MQGPLPRRNLHLRKNISLHPEEGSRSSQVWTGPDWGNDSGKQGDLATHVCVYLSWEASQDISIPQFVHGYMIVMECQDMALKERMASHLKELLLDVELYGWEYTRALHGIWLNQMKQGRCTWINEEEKRRFCRALVWHPVHSSPSPTTTTMTS